MHAFPHVFLFIFLFTLPVGCFTQQKIDKSDWILFQLKSLGVIYCGYSGIYLFIHSRNIHGGWFSHTRNYVSCWGSKVTRHLWSEEAVIWGMPGPLRSPLRVDLTFNPHCSWFTDQREGEREVLVRGWHHKHICSFQVNVVFLQYCAVYNYKMV